MIKSFSIVIPTYNRQKELGNCLTSILRQDLLPAEIILVDDAELGEEFLQYWKKESTLLKINLVYYRKDPAKEQRGSSSSRNIGLNLAKEKICFILDDDLQLENYFFKETMAAWNDDPNLLGVGGVIINNRSKNIWEKRYNKFFGLRAGLSWDINEIGFQSWDDGIGDRQTAFYVHGGVCSYDKEIVKKLGGFTVFGGGREALEDVDFCWRAKLAGYFFLIEPQARVFHAQSASGREDGYALGYKESFNRQAIFKKLGGKELNDFLGFYWANVGWILRQILTGKFKKARGMIKGLI
ncbi:MAG: glycosyltransferase [Patescibacteria group bacterium]|nr:glycosyltransferase [Patescibacteria group bacterium]